MEGSRSGHEEGRRIQTQQKYKPRPGGRECGAGVGRKGRGREKGGDRTPCRSREPPTQEPGMRCPSLPFERHQLPKPGVHGAYKDRTAECAALHSLALSRASGRSLRDAFSAEVCVEIRQQEGEELPVRQSASYLHSQLPLIRVRFKRRRENRRFKYVLFF